MFRVVVYGFNFRFLWLSYSIFRDCDLGFDM